MIGRSAQLFMKNDSPEWYILEFSLIVTNARTIATRSYALEFRSEMSV